MPFSRRDFLAFSSAFTGACYLPYTIGQSAIAAEKQSRSFIEITPESDEALQKANKWLLRSIRSDGGCGVDVAQPADIGCTAMVGLALMSQGTMPVAGPYCRELRNILGFMRHAVEKMPSGDITAATNTQLQYKIGRHAHTFFAALFFSQMLGEAHDAHSDLQDLSRLVDVLERSQNKHGHWGDESWAPVLGTVMGWVALSGAHLAGFHIDASAKKTADFLLKIMRSNEAEEGGSWMHKLYKNAAGVRVLYPMGLDHERVAAKAYKDVLKVIQRDNTPFSQAGGEEYLAFHLITETMLQRGGDDWATWYPLVRDKILAVQNSDGSWTGKHCITSRTFCTAAAALVLSAPNRFLPISQL